MIHLRKKDKDAICDLARECFSSPVALWAYGSRVDGTSHDGSDRDLVARGANLKPIDLSEFAEFTKKLADSQIPILVQVFDWARMPESFQSNILDGYVEIYP